MTDGGVHDGIADDGVAFFDRVPVNGGLGDAAGEDRDFFHAPERFFRPRDRVFGLLVDRRHVFLVGDHHVAVDHAQEVFGVGADVHIIVAVYPEPAHHQHPRFLAPDILQDLFEGLAVE